MPGVRHITCIAAVTVATAAAGCGGAGDPAEGLVDSVDKARAASALSSLQTALVTLSVVQSDSAPASAGDIAAALQEKDPTHRYTTDVPSDTGAVQVVGTGGGPVMLVALSEPASEAGPARYAAAWHGGGTTMYYAGASPPAFRADRPAGAGWGSTLPQ